MESNLFVSFIIPVLNGEETILKTVNSIFAQKINLSFEIIVVDNGSSDRTLAKLSGLDVKIIIEKIRGRSHARNCGLNYAKGKWICFVDADVILGPNWFDSMIPFLKEDFFDIFSGRIQPKANSSNIFSKFREEYLSEISKGTFNLLDDNITLSPILNSAAILIRRSSLLKVDGFDRSFNTFEDIDLSKRLWLGGANFCTVNEAVANVFWEKGGFFSYFIRSFLMGRGFATYEKKWLSKDLNMVPRWKRFSYSSFSYQLIDFIMQFFFTMGYQTLISSSDGLISHNLFSKPKKIFCKDLVIILKPSIGLIKTSRNLRLCHRKGEFSFDLPLESFDISQAIYSNINIVLQNKLGILLNKEDLDKENIIS